MFRTANRFFFFSLFSLSLLVAADSTWEIGGPGALNNPSPPPVGNWSNGLPNAAAADVGTFTNNGAPLNPTLNIPLVVSNLTFSPTSPTLNFNLSSPAALTITGGIVNESGASQIFNLNDSSLTFSGNSPSSTAVNVSLSKSVSGSELNITGTAGTTVALGMMSANAGNSVVVENNTLKTSLGGTVDLALVQPGAVLLLEGGNTDGIISGLGSLVVDTGQEFVMLGASTYSGGTTIRDGAALVLFGEGNLNPIGSVNFLSGSDQSRLVLEGTPGPMTYTIGDLVGSGTNGFFQIERNTLIAGASNSTTFNGTLTGSTFVKQGTGTLIFGGSGFIDSLEVNQGNFELNGFNEGTTLTVQGQGTLSGTGFAIANVNVMNGGTMAPGNGLGTLSVNNSYFQGPGTNYLVEINGALNSKTFVSGNATLTGGEVFADLVSLSSFNTAYPILTTEGALLGQFSGVSASTFLVQPTLSYPDGMNAFLTFFPAFTRGARTYNQTEVALQFDTLTHLDLDESLVVAGLFALDSEGVASAYDDLGGNQYTADPFIDSILARGFIRRLYDPLRPIITSIPCQRCESPCGFDLWLESSYDRAFLKNDGNGFGFNLTGWEITAGVQKTFSDWTIGLAGSYGHDFVRYNLAGHGKIDSGFFGLYGLWRPCSFYILGDAIYGIHSNSISRNISIGDFKGVGKSEPEAQEITFYTEAGVDLPLCCFLFQPFIGLETCFYRRGYLTENGLSDFDLILDKREETTAISRLGLHLSTCEILRGFSLNLDLSWDYQFTRTRNDFKAHFAAFGNEFTMRGVKIPHGSFEGELALIKEFNKNFLGFVEFSGQIWTHSSWYSLTVGLQNTF